MKCIPTPFNGGCTCRNCGRPFSPKANCNAVNRTCTGIVTPLSPEEKQRRAGASKALAASAKQDVQVAAEKLGLRMKDVTHYAKALATWAKAGFPTRSDEETAAVYAICKECENNVSDRCKLCGCRVSPTGMALGNKARMATESCPLKKW
jgi:hypothetical protein